MASNAPEYLDEDLITVQVEISPTAYQEKSIIRNLMQYYLGEFSQISDVKLDNTGQFKSRYLDHYWTEPDRYPFLLKVQGELAGFVLLRRGTYFPQKLDSDQTGMLIAEFFVMKGYRRQGVGTRAALDSFARFPGRWEIAQKTSNNAGQSFWRAVVNTYCGGEFKEYVLDNDSWCGPVQVFDNYSFAAY